MVDSHRHPDAEHHRDRPQYSGRLGLWTDLLTGLLPISVVERASYQDIRNSPFRSMTWDTSSSRITPSKPRTKSGPYAVEGVWKPGGAPPATTRSTTASAARTVSVYPSGPRNRV